MRPEEGARTLSTVVTALSHHVCVVLGVETRSPGEQSVLLTTGPSLLVLPLFSLPLLLRHGLVVIAQDDFQLDSVDSASWVL